MRLVLIADLHFGTESPSLVPRLHAAIATALRRGRVTADRTTRLHLEDVRARIAEILDTDES